MCSISTRLDALNRQLVIISKLQKMEEEYGSYSYTTCKKCNVYNNHDKCCHCIHRIISLKEQCNKFHCTDECLSYENKKKKILCNLDTCKTRRKVDSYKNAQLTEAQTYLKNDAQISTSTYIENDIISKELEDPQKESKSNQINLSSELYKMHTEDKILDTYEEKSEQTIPTKDYDHTELKTNSVSMINTQYEVPKQRKSQTEINNNNNNRNETENTVYNIEDICIKDRKIFEGIQKDLLNEKKQTKELKTKLKSLTCSINCLKEDNEQRAACLKGALETAEEQTKVAMDLMKQSKDQTDLIKADRDVLLDEIARLKQQTTEVAHKNAALLQERDDLRNKLQSLSEDESERCKEVEKEVNRLKHAVKEKEDALSKERAEFMNMILELTNVINIQKRRICEVTDICNNQQHIIQEKDKELSENNTELAEVKNALQSSTFTIKEMEMRIENLEQCLYEETKSCECLKQELENLKENHLSELRIKETIIEEQNRTISKQKKLLHDTENMVQQVASEFDQLKNELHKEKQKSESLKITLNETDGKLNKLYLTQCDKCEMLIAEIDYLKKEKQKAVAVAKFAYQKLHQSVKDYHRKLVCEKQQHKYMALIIERKQHEISCLKNQICQNNMRIV